MQSYSSESELQICHWGRCSVGQVTTWVPVPQPPGTNLLNIRQGGYFKSGGVKPPQLPGARLSLIL